MSIYFPSNIHQSFVTVWHLFASLFTEAGLVSCNVEPWCFAVAAFQSAGPQGACMGMFPTRDFQTMNPKDLHSWPEKLRGWFISQNISGE